MTKYRSIDALRGFASLWVLAYHLWCAYFPTANLQNCSPSANLPSATELPLEVLLTMPLFGFGYAGICLFFVLSGFCIHLPQARRFQKTGHDGLDKRSFASRRFWRLYPAFFASLFLAGLGFFAMNFCWESPPGEAGITFHYFLEATGAVWIGMNAFFLFAIKPEATIINAVYWTLWLELQFYLFYPLLLRACRSWGFGRIAMFLLAIELLLSLVPALVGAEKLMKPPLEWLFLCRYFEWFLGMLLAEKCAKGSFIAPRTSLIVVFAGFSGGMLLALHPIGHSIHQLVFSIGSFGVVGYFIAPSLRKSESRSIHLFGWFGDYSYSLYLVQIPVMRIVYALETQLPMSYRGYTSFYAAGAVCLVLVPVVAWCLYQLVEKRFMKGSPPRIETGAIAPVESPIEPTPDDHPTTARMSSSVIMRYSLPSTVTSEPA